MEDKLIRVMIVEDTKSTAMMLSRILSAFHIVGIADSGAEALKINSQMRPHVITMDIILPDTDGLTLTRHILSQRHIPIIIVSGQISPDESTLLFDALRAGAYDVFSKNGLFKPEQFNKLLRMVRTAGSLRRQQSKTTVTSPQIDLSKPVEQPVVKNDKQILAIGTSTGGPAALRQILSELPPNFPLPILVTQHIAEGFLKGFVSWLDSQTPLSVHLAEKGQIPKPSCVYISPSDQHLLMNQNKVIDLLPRDDSHSLCPSVDLLFDSVSLTYGPKAICLILTGMGFDGADGMLLARQRQSICLAQDESTSVVFGMPKEAIERNAVHYILPLPKIAPWLIKNRMTE